MDRELWRSWYEVMPCCCPTCGIAVWVVAFVGELLQVSLQVCLGKRNSTDMETEAVVSTYVAPLVWVD